MTQFPERLVQQYHRFKHRHFDPTMYEELATYGQSPEVMIVSCCDSRVDPETIFSALPGELFVMRNVANLVPPYETGGTYHGVSAAIEFAVLNLRIKHLVVMGHAGCGGVKAALDREAALQTEAEFISKWMSMLEQARLKVLAGHQGASRKEMVQALEHEGIKTSLSNLRTFPFLKELEDNGRLNLHGAYFDIGTGKLYALNEATGKFYDL
ncbi:MAG: carbonate dehydratase [Porticoccaceae bacterium]|nr:carbonate dehydratase [Porticoccaceae bacterium]